MKIRDTLNLPRTKFPMKANLSRNEPKILQWWEEIKLYKTIREARKGSPVYMFHDGPPYANGEIHIGTALNKILKDVVVRYKTLRGFDCPFVPGWDTHGLPIELQVMSKLREKADELSIKQLRKECRRFALHFMEVQRKQFKRLGGLADWDHPYLTLEPAYEAKQIEVFSELYRSGYVFRGKKPIYWCTHCETALAEAEIEYRDHMSPSIYVKFPTMSDLTGILQKPYRYNIYFVIWTTTPWTLPANVAICLKPDTKYAVVAAGDENYIIAEYLVPVVMNELGFDDYYIVETVSSDKLEGIVCHHPFVDRESQIILGNHVTMDTGTGCVHTAPGHGQEDYEIGLKYKLPIISPLDHRGIFTIDAGDFAHLHYEKANADIVCRLEEDGYLLKSTDVSHQYPHCWRCKKPVIFRATKQWFISVENSDLRDRSLEAIKKVKWIPDWGQRRITGMVESRPDWCISRQRYWGVPIPVFYCLKCGHEVVNANTLEAVIKLFSEDGSGAWYTEEADNIVPAGTRCPKCKNSHFRKESDILDVWFDSGVSHRAVLETREGHSWPSQLYLEGSDQHRGWFQTSLLTSIGTRGLPPYRTVLTHGFVVDGDGRKMSKSLGNVIAPQEIVGTLGADVLRLWVVMADYKEDIRISDEIMKQVVDAYRKLRNTLRFILGNLRGFRREEAVPFESMLEVDRYAVARTRQVLRRAEASFERFEFYRIYHDLVNYTAVDLSSFYLDVIKDRLYTAPRDTLPGLSARTALSEILWMLLAALGPVMPFTCEEVWQYMEKDSNDPETVALLSWPSSEAPTDEKFMEKWSDILSIRSTVLNAIESFRSEGRHSLDAEIVLYPLDKRTETLLGSMRDCIEELLIVSSVEMIPLGADIPDEAVKDETVAVMVRSASGERCSRCWKRRDSTGVEYQELCDRCFSIVKDRYPEVLATDV